MNCQEVEILLSSMLDRKLSTEEEQAVTGHVDACEKCRTTLAELRKVVELLGSLPAESCPRVVADHLRDVVLLSAGKQGAGDQPATGPVEMPKAEPVTYSFFLRYKHFVQIAVAAAAVLLIVLGNIFIFDQQAERKPAIGETAFDKRNRSKEAPAGRTVDVARKEAGTPGESESKDTGAGYSAKSIGKGGALEDSLGELREGESRLKQQVVHDAPEEAQKLVETELGALSAEKDLEAGKEKALGGSNGGGAAARKRIGGQDAKPVVDLPSRTVVISTASREASRQRVDDIVLRTIGEKQGQKAEIAGKPAAPTTVEALEKKTRGGADPAREPAQDSSLAGANLWDADRQPATGLSWHKAAPAARSLREARNGPGDERSKSGDDENVVRELEEKSEADKLCESPAAIFLTVEVSEAEAATIIGRLHAEALVGMDFASSLDVVPDEEIDSYSRSLGFVPFPSGAADAPGAAPQTGEGGPADKAAGEAGEMARRQLTDKDKVGGLVGDMSAQPAGHDGEPETTGGVGEIAKTPGFKGKTLGDEKEDSLVVTETKPRGEALDRDEEKLKKEKELRLPAAEPKPRLLRLVIVLVEKSTEPAK